MANRKYIVGNWKMNGLQAQLSDITDIATLAISYPGVDVAIAPPVTLISDAAQNNRQLQVGAQDCHANESGAHTGCISAEMLKEAGASFVILGHSERRADCGETNAIVKSKAEAAHRADLPVIICVGETEQERDAGRAADVVCGQIVGSLPVSASSSWVTIAYEPIWAIGTGRIPSTSDVGEIHLAIRNKLNEIIGEGANSVRILYGGSMNGDNAAELLAVKNVDGGLVGGASLTGPKFGPIIEAAANAS